MRHKQAQRFMARPGDGQGQSGLEATVKPYLDVQGGRGHAEQSLASPLEPPACAAPPSSAALPAAAALRCCAFAISSCRRGRGRGGGRQGGRVGSTEPMKTKQGRPLASRAGSATYPCSRVPARTERCARARARGKAEGKPRQESDPRTWGMPRPMLKT